MNMAHGRYIFVQKYTSLALQQLDWHGMTVDLIKCGGKLVLCFGVKMVKENKNTTIVCYKDFYSLQFHVHFSKR